jgi:hypothetical protein
MSTRTMHRSCRTRWDSQSCRDRRTCTTARPRHGTLLPLDQLRAERGLHRLGPLRHAGGRRARRQRGRWDLAAHLRRQGPLDVDGIYPSGFQPYRTSHFDLQYWLDAGLPEEFAQGYLNSQADSYNHPNGPSNRVSRHSSTTNRREKRFPGRSRAKGAPRMRSTCAAERWTRSPTASAARSRRGLSGRPRIGEPNRQSRSGGTGASHIREALVPLGSVRLSPGSFVQAGPGVNQPISNPPLTLLPARAVSRQFRSGGLSASRDRQPSFS